MEGGVQGLESETTMSPESFSGGARRRRRSSKRKSKSRGGFKLPVSLGGSRRKSKGRKGKRRGTRRR